MAIPVKSQAQPPAQTIEDVLIRGDLSKLNESQRTEYYLRVCQSVGLNHLTKPFQYLVLNGQLRLYATRDCADQLRKLNGISLKIISQEKSDGLYSVHVHAKDRDGREDEDLGVVAFNENYKGEAAANAILKAVTKAKRRVTLSISGLGFLDETEVADIPAAAKQAAPDGELINQRQIEELIKLADMGGADKRLFCGYLAKRYGEPIGALSEIPARHFDDARAELYRKLEAIDKAEAEAQRT